MIYYITIEKPSFAPEMLVPTDHAHRISYLSPEKQARYEYCVSEFASGETLSEDLIEELFCLREELGTNKKLLALIQEEITEFNIILTEIHNRKLNGKELSDELNDAILYFVFSLEIKYNEEIVNAAIKDDTAVHQSNGFQRALTAFNNRDYSEEIKSCWGNWGQFDEGL